MPPINLTGLYPQAYEHPEDAAALDALMHTPGFEAIVRKVNEWSVERLLRIQLTGSYLKVTPDALPDLWELLTTARDRLSVPITPDFYIANDEQINAYTSGTQSPTLVVNSGAIEGLERDELFFVIAHEIGHMKSGHVLYYQMASYLPSLGNLLGEMTLGVGNLLSQGVRVALLHWQRASELTADRAGLLACQDKAIALRALMKLAGLPRQYSGKMDVTHFIKQAEEFESFDASIPNRLAKILSIYSASHPWTVLRANELLRWIESGGYEHVLSMFPFRRSTPLPLITRTCTNCRTDARPNERFCRKCGNALVPATS